MNTSTKHGEDLHIYKAIIDGIEYKFELPEVSGKEILLKAGKKPTECHSLYQKLEKCDFELVREDDIVDLRNLSIEHFQVKEPIVFHYTVNNEPETTEHKQLTATQILKQAGINPEEFYLIQLQDHGPKIIYAFDAETPIKMVCPGLHFITERWVALVDIEEYGKTCKDVPPARQYKIKVDKNYHVVNSPFITGKELIGLENKQPIQNWDAYKFYSNQAKPVKVGHNETVDLTEKCLVRFVLQPKEQKDGRNNRKEFALPTEDVEFLDKLGLPWETLSSAGLWVLVHDYPIPAGYNTPTVEIALMVAPSYPATEIDMAYFYPQLQKKDGKPINAVSSQAIDGRCFQRWSRHRLPGEWKPGIDNILTHLALVDNWLANDLKR